MSARLVLQLESLGVMAALLGLNAESKEWKRRSEKQLTDLLAHSVKDGRFVSPVSGSHVIKECHSLIDYTPILLGRRLPTELLARLISDLSPGGPFLTEHGLSPSRLLARIFHT